MCSPPGPLNHLPILGSFRFLCGYFGKQALRHDVLRCFSSVSTGLHLRFVEPHGSVIQTPALLHRPLPRSGRLAFVPLAFSTWWFCFVWANTTLPHHHALPRRASSSGFSPSSSLSHDELWSSSSSMLLVHLCGQFTPMCLCSPQS